MRLWLRATLLVLTGMAVAAGFILLHEPVGTRQLDISLAARLPQHATQVAPLRLAAGLIPPTNRWFSSLVFSKNPQPIFAYPLSFKPTSAGFELDAPQVTASAQAIFGAHRPTLQVNLGAAGSQVSAYDDLTVALAHTAGGRTVATTRLAQGSPYAFVTLPEGGTVHIAASGQFSQLHADGRLITAGNQVYGVVSAGPITSDSGKLTLTVAKGGTFAVFAVASGGEAQTYYEAAHYPVTGGAVTYEQSNNRLTTTYHLKSTGGATLFAPNPNLPLDHPVVVAGTYQTLLGTQMVAAGNDFSSSLAMQALPTQLDLAKLSPVDKTMLIRQLTADANSLTFPAHDTYFSGKELYRAANLLQLAHQLEQTEVARSIQSKLKAELSTWLDPAGQSMRAEKYFYYDTTYKGLVGVTASFGAEQFNDHHFHYGYFLYAAAVLARYDKDFYAAARPMVNVLISDIASPAQTERFPKLRVFDAYAGHSWASGNGDFADGNNQESSSEAANAWYAVYLWADVSHDVALRAEGQWLYQLETTAATTQWLHQAGPPLDNGFAHPFVSLVWGGKLDFATFFSARPQALLGIQLIPMSPGQGYLSAGGAPAIARNLTAVTPAGYDGAFGDYLLMYQALGDPAAARAGLATFSPASLDSANSMAYLQAWVLSR